jgi:transposase
MRKGEKIPREVCENAVRDYQRGGRSAPAVAAKYNMTAKTLFSLLRRLRTTGTFYTARRGRAPRLGPTELARLKELALAQPTLSWEELRAALQQETGTSISRSAFGLALHRLGIFNRGPYKDKRRSAPSPKREANPSAPEAPKKKYNYKPKRKRRYPSDMTDEEWGVAQDIFARKRVGAPSTVDRRAILDAIFYVSRSGCQWRMLPKDFPNWKTVYSCFSRWQKKGIWEELATRLRKRHRSEAGREAEPSAGSVDSQSVKTTEKGGPRGLTATRK